MDGFAIFRDVGVSFVCVGFLYFLLRLILKAHNLLHMRMLMLDNLLVWLRH